MPSGGPGGGPPPGADDFGAPDDSDASAPAGGTLRS
jgi:hypothetical protein